MNIESEEPITAVDAKQSLQKIDKEGLVYEQKICLDFLKKHVNAQRRYDGHNNDLFPLPGSGDDHQKAHKYRRYPHETEQFHGFHIGIDQNSQQQNSQPFFYG